MSEHVVTIEVEEYYDGVTDWLEYWAECSCGWEGPKRSTRNETDEDARAHQAGEEVV